MKGKPAGKTDSLPASIAMPAKSSSSTVPQWGPDESRRLRMGFAIADILHLLLLGLLLNAMFIPELQVSSVIRWVAVGGLLLSITRGHGWLILLVSQAYFVVSEPGNTIFSPDLPDVRFCFATLALVAYAYRFQAVRHLTHSWLAQRWFAAFVAEPETTAKVTAAEAVSDSHARRRRTADRSESIEEPANSTDHPFAEILIPMRDGLLTWVGMGCTSLLLAIFILALLPYGEFVSDRILFRSVREGKTLLPGATVCALAVGLLVLVRELAWRQHTGAQAALYLRSVFTMEHFRDLQMIVRRQMRMARRKRRDSPTA